MITRCSRTRVLLSPIACVLLLSACPLPIARTEATSAPIVGTIVRADGTPATDVDVGVETDWKWDEVACTRTVVRARTDRTGAFQLPGTTKHYSTTWFVPNLDLVAPSFRLCAGVGDTLRRAYLGRGSLSETAEPDSVTCVAWEWEASPRVSCVGRAQHDVVTGGAWTDATDGSAGFYRLFLTEEPTRVKGYDKDKPQDRPYVYVQWVEPRAPALPPGTPPYRVRATISLDFDRNKVRGVHELQLWRREGPWLASLHGSKSAFMNDFARAELVFELGPPGIARKVAGP